MSKQSKTVSQKIAELEVLVAWFEGDEFVLEEAADKFDAARALAGEIEQDLLTLKNNISVVKQKFDEA